ncbi:MAG: SUMF1/EgtB/PvdO family nonheme iron enzyme [Deltaproteobacteria bacterium]|nr:SUMF1/EgtB/PvdO family nonheme iron enzyme [Deltaproteobacteria bacterium]
MVRGRSLDRVKRLPFMETGRGFCLALFSILIFLLTAAPVNAVTCQGCHTKPEYSKEDVTRLKECLNCHGSAGHPLENKAAGLFLRGIAEASDEKPPAALVKGHAGIDTSAMALIPEGEFLMGTDDRLRDEKPAMVVYLDGFYIDRYEVTNRDYKTFVDAAGHNPPDNWEKGAYPRGMGKHPVIFVNWYDADSYCRWAGKRLPREAEWEKGARGVDGRVYPWGNQWDMRKSNNPLMGHEGTEPAGSFPAGKSPYGLYDMSGNVWEWVDDDYLPHAGSDYVSPEFGGGYKMLKGGSWWDCMFYGCGISAPAYNRSFFDPNTKNDSFGFRCAAGAPRGDVGAE